MTDDQFLAEETKKGLLATSPFTLCAAINYPTFGA